MDYNIDHAETDEKTPDKEPERTIFQDIIRPLLIFIGALAILMTKGYISAKLLLGLIMLDYMTKGYINKIPLPICFIIFMVLTTLAVI